MQVAIIRLRLRGFAEPSTGSQFEGHLSPGRYQVLEYRPAFPNDDTDYVRVEAPGLGANDTWLCSRWKNQRYAEVLDVQLTLSAWVPSQENDSIPESAIVANLPAFHKFEYDRDNARYPETLPGVQLPMTPPESNNCCTFVEALLVKSWADEVPDFQWSAARHHQMMIMSSDDYFSPVAALVESGMAIAETDPDSIPGPWTVIQGWRHQWRGGHTFIIVDHDPETDRVLTLESNSSYGLNGVGFRKIGNLNALGGEPPDQWWARPDLWTWQKISATYAYHSKARLKVKDLAWSTRS
jgi:hypothetical protein